MLSIKNKRTAKQSVNIENPYIARNLKKVLILRLSDATSQQDKPTANQQQLNLFEIELQKPQQNSSNPKKPEAEHSISGIQGEMKEFSMKLRIGERRE
ncbi:hypothetical protein JTB14_001193 [Gonioctena quinquepunctata]|nr:hypothetical protein JTB14_001193 [Gonioctena quinquepunctata]